MRLRSANKVSLSNTQSVRISSSSLERSSRAHAPKKRTSPRITIVDLESSDLEKILSFFFCPRGCKIESNESVDLNSLMSARLSCAKIRDIVDSLALWSSVPLVLTGKILNLAALRLTDLKTLSSGKRCDQVACRGPGSAAEAPHELYCLKRPHSFQDCEGVQYYIIREIAALRRLSHPNIVELKAARFLHNQLYLLYPYVAQSLQDILYPNETCFIEEPCGTPLKRKHAVALMQQLMDALGYCHGLRMLHRNIKPKHLRITVRGISEDPLDGALLQLADFSLMRPLPQKKTKLTAEVTSLWYRPPELLMGDLCYREAADIWSAACVFAEMLRGSPLFCGFSQIDQLFQIFSKLGTPTTASWPSFESLPYYNPTLFPHWLQPGDNPHHSGQPQKSLSTLITSASSADLELLSLCFQCDPLRRPTVAEILIHQSLLPPAHEIITERIKFISKKGDFAYGPATDVLISRAELSLRKLQVKTCREQEIKLESTRRTLSCAMAGNDKIQLWQRRCSVVARLMSTEEVVSEKISSRAIHLAVALLDCVVAGIYNSLSNTDSGTQPVYDLQYNSPTGIDGIEVFDAPPSNDIGIEFELEKPSWMYNTSPKNVAETHSDGKFSIAQSLDYSGLAAHVLTSSHCLWNHPRNSFSSIKDKLERSGGYMSALHTSHRDSHGKSSVGTHDDAFERLVSNTTAAPGENEIAPQTVQDGPSVFSSPGTPQTMVNEQQPPALPDGNALFRSRCGLPSETAGRNRQGILRMRGEMDRSFEVDGSLEVDELLVVGMTCLHIAAKLEDVAFISMEHLLPLIWRGELSDRLRYEERILTALEFDFHHTTMMDFIPYFCDSLSRLLHDEDEALRMSHFAEFLAYLCLSSGHFAGDRYSSVAAAICCYSCIITKMAKSEEQIPKSFFRNLFASMQDWADADQFELSKDIERIIHFHARADRVLSGREALDDSLSSSLNRDDVYIIVQKAHAGVKSWLSCMDMPGIRSRACQALRHL